LSVPTSAQTEGEKLQPPSPGMTTKGPCQGVKTYAAWYNIGGGIGGWRPGYCFFVRPGEGPASTSGDSADARHGPGGTRAISCDGDQSLTTVSVRRPIPDGEPAPADGARPPQSSAVPSAAPRVTGTTVTIGTTAICVHLRFHNKATSAWRETIIGRTYSPPAVRPDRGTAIRAVAGMELRMNADRADPVRV